MSEKPTIVSLEPIKNRILLLDFLRGFSVISMVGFHAMYDIVFIFGVDASWFLGWPGKLWQISISWVFMLVSGATLHYSSRPVRRGIVVFGCGMLVTVVTLLFMPSERILFGVLHSIGFSMIVCGAFKPQLMKLSPIKGAALFSALFVLTKGVPNGFLGILEYSLINLPSILYKSPFLFFAGFPQAGFWSSDYFPIIPWIFLYISGFYIWGLVKNKVPAKQRKPNFIERVGRYTLPIYVAHQPLVFGILFLFFSLKNR